MHPRLLAIACLAMLAPTLGACHRYYFAGASVPLVAPLDSACIRSAIADRGRHRRSNSGSDADGRTSVIAYSTPAMFHSQWESLGQFVRRDSSVHLGKTYRDSTISLGASYVQINQRIELKQGLLLTGDMARSLLDLRDACGGASPGGERLFSVGVTETPYEAWAVPGTSSRVVMRMTVDSIRYRLTFPLNAGLYTLRVDTLASGTEPRFPRWIEADTMPITAPGKRTTLATSCWRGDSLPAGDLVALMRDTDSAYLIDAIEAWALDRQALRIRAVPTAGIECHIEGWGGDLASAPPLLRSAALTFRPSPGMARVYLIMTRPKFPTRHEMPRIAIDSQIVGRLGGGSFLMAEIEPGRHRISAPAWRAESALLLDAAPDSSYFIEVRQKRLVFAHAALSPMDPDAAKQAIRRAHMVSSSWPGTPMPRRR